MRRRTQTILLAASLVLIVATLRTPLLAIPFERDEGEYAYIAWRLAYNELPYRDWVDQKPPAVFYVYRLALSLPIEPFAQFIWSDCYSRQHLSARSFFSQDA